MDVMKNVRRYPEKYKEWNGGPYWNSLINLVQLVDQLMCLLFLEIVKSSRLLIDEQSCKKRNIQFYKEVLNIVYGTIPSMRLD